MKRTITIVALALALGAGTASAVGIGLGVFGGLAYPIVQDDARQGSVFGVRVPVSLVPLISVEPFYSSSTLGDVNQTFGTIPYTRDGGKLTVYGVNALLGTMGVPGLKFYPIVGIGSGKLERNGSPDITKTVYDVGLGLSISPIPKLELNARGELDVLVLDNTSRKYGNATAGVAYHFLSLP